MLALLGKFNSIVLHGHSGKYSWVKGVRVFTPFMGEKTHKQQLFDSPYRLSPISRVCYYTSAARVQIYHKLRSAGADSF